MKTCDTKTQQNQPAESWMKHYDIEHIEPKHTVCIKCGKTPPFETLFRDWRKRLWVRLSIGLVFWFFFRWFHWFFRFSWVFLGCSLVVPLVFNRAAFGPQSTAPGGWCHAELCAFHRAQPWRGIGSPNGFFPNGIPCAMAKALGDLDSICSGFWGFFKCFCCLFLRVWSVFWGYDWLKLMKAVIVMAFWV